MHDNDKPGKLARRRRGGSGRRCWWSRTTPPSRARSPEVLRAGVQERSCVPLWGLSEAAWSARHVGAAQTAAPTAGPEQCWRERDPHSGRLGPALLATPWTRRLCELGLRSVSRLEMGPSPVPSVPAGQTVLKEREEMTRANETQGDCLGTEGGSSGVRVRAIMCRDRVRWFGSLCLQ